MATCPFSRDFSRKTRSQLAKRGFSITGATAIPAFEGDVYSTGTAYCLIDAAVNGEFWLRFREVLALAETGANAPAWESANA